MVLDLFSGLFATTWIKTLVNGLPHYMYEVSVYEKVMLFHVLGTREKGEKTDLLMS